LQGDRRIDRDFQIFRHDIGRSCFEFHHSLAARGHAARAT
jgi:hypothetical protein